MSRIHALNRARKEIMSVTSITGDGQGRTEEDQHLLELCHAIEAQIHVMGGRVDQLNTVIHQDGRVEAHSFDPVCPTTAEDWNRLASHVGVR